MIITIITCMYVVACTHLITAVCKSCIVKHLQSNKSCPICNTLVHETQPLLNLRYLVGWWLQGTGWSVLYTCKVIFVQSVCTQSTHRSGVVYFFGVQLGFRGGWYWGGAAWATSVVGTGGLIISALSSKTGSVPVAVLLEAFYMYNVCM